MAQIPRRGPARTPDMGIPNAPYDAIGAGIAQFGEEMQRTFGHLAERRFNAIASQNIEIAKIDFQAEAQEIGLSELQNAQANEEDSLAGVSTYSLRVANRLREAQNRYLSRFTDARDDVQARALPDIQRIGEAAGYAAAQQEHQLTGQFQRQRIADAENKVIAGSTNPHTVRARLDSLYEIIDTAQHAGYLDADQVPGIKKQLELRAFQAAIDTQFSMRPGQFSMMVLNGQLKNVIPGELAPQTMERAVRQAREDLADQVLAGADQIVSAPVVETPSRSADTDFQERIQQIQARLDTLDAQMPQYRSVFTDAQILDRIRAPLEAGRRQIEHQYAMFRRGEAIAAGAPADPANPTDLKALEAFAQTRVLPRLSGPDGAERYIQAVKDTPILPQSLKFWASGRVRSTDPEQALMGARAIQGGLAISPFSAGNFTDQELALASTISVLSATGTPPAQAVELARSAVLGGGDPERKARLTRFDAEIKEALKDRPDYWARGLTARLDDTPGFDPISPFAGVPEIPPFMADQYADLTRAFYQLTGDMTAAQDAASRRVASQWGVTEQNGEREIMYLAPEVSGQDAISPGWVQEDWLESLRNEAVLPEGVGPEAARKALIAVPINGRRVYTALVDVDGVPQPLSRKDGTVWLYTPVFSESPRYRRKAAEFEERRAIDERIRASGAGAAVSEVSP